MDLKKERKERKLSQQKLADKTGIPKSRIEKWETGKAKPKTEDSEILKKFFFENESPSITQNGKVNAASIYGNAMAGELAAKDKEIETLQARLRDKEELLKGKDEIIELLKSQLKQQTKK